MANLYEYFNGHFGDYQKGYDDGFNAKIQTIKLHPTEAIVLHFSFTETTIEELKFMYEIAKENFPNNSIVVLPDKISLESCSKDVLENYISMISEIIESL